MPETLSRPVTLQELRQELAATLDAIKAYIHQRLGAPEQEAISPQLEARLRAALAEVDAGARCYTTEELNRELGL